MKKARIDRRSRYSSSHPKRVGDQEFCIRESVDSEQDVKSLPTLRRLLLIEHFFPTAPSTLCCDIPRHYPRKHTTLSLPLTVTPPADFQTFLLNTLASSHPYPAVTPTLRLHTRPTIHSTVILEAQRCTAHSCHT